ncbi:MFS transporter [Asanoa ferruginea]|uniref:MFS transporter n=1 Tax=Asanoa ferruginea TaxID=53367 RepID=A0A3D9ZJA5_9ACTN|nr:MFS transporter [Asanoa ferruginea]REF97468.1 MFS transporter [Asanoa ferruginea]
MDLPRPFWFLWVGTLINRFGYFVIPFLTLYLVRHQGFDPATAGAVVSAFGAGSLVSQPLGGWLTDRVGRRPTLVAGMLATAAAYLALGAAASPLVLTACAVAAGLATDLYRPAVAAIVADLVAPEQQRRAFGLLYWAINLGVGVASVLGGMLAERNFGLLFVIDAITCVGFAAIVLIAVPETKPARSAAATATALDPRLVGLTASTFVVAVVYFQGFVTLPLAMQAHGLDAAAYGLVAAVNPVVILVCQPILMRLLAKHSLVYVYAISGVLSGIGFGLTLAAESTAGFAATVVVWTLGEIALNISAPAILAAIAPADMRGRYQGVWGTSWGLAMLVAPVAGTATWQRFGAGPLWLGCLVAASAATCSLLVWRAKWTVMPSPA